MAAAPRSYEYVLVRMAPDPIRKEFLNVGVALYETGGDFADARVIADERRLRCLFPNFDDEILRGLEDDLRGALRRRERPFGREDLLYLAGETFSQSLELSPRHGLATSDPAASLEDLYRRLVAPPRPARTERPPRAGRRRVLRELKRVFAEREILARLAYRQPANAWAGGADPFRFDFHYRPNGIHKLVHAVDLAADTRGVKELAFTADELRGALRRHGLGLEVSAIHEEPRDALLALDVAFSLPPPAVQAPHGEREEPEPSGVPGLVRLHREILATAGIRLRPLAAAGELAEAIARELT